MEIFQVIESENEWSLALDQIETIDPCHEYIFHKAYANHMNASKIIMLKVQEGLEIILYPFLLFRVPENLASEK